MDSTRQLKISRLLQKELGDILQRADSSLTQRRMLTVTEVRISPDLSVARAYVSVFPSQDADVIINGLNQNLSLIRGELGNRIRHQVRIIPKLQFFLDDSMDYAERIDALLAE